MKWILTILVSIAAFQLGHSQHVVRFEHLATEDGLANTQVQTLLQDSRGFLWIGTLGGLHRYDGYSFTIFRRSFDDSTSIANNTILAMCEDKEGTLWLGTREGLVKYDPRTEKFKNYRAGFGNTNWLNDKSIRSVVDDDKGSLWLAVSGDGLVRFDKSKNTFVEKFIFDEQKEQTEHVLLSNHIKSIVIDKSGNLWLATDVGLSFFNPLTKEFHTYLPGIEKNKGLPDRFVKALCFDRQGNLWIGTDGGLGKAKIKNDRIESFTNFYADENDPYTLNNNLVKSILEDQDGNVWIATDRGLNVYEPGSNIFKRFLHDESNPRSVGSNYCRFLLTDNQGIIWVATDRGISVYDKEAYPFRLFAHIQNNVSSLSSNYVNAIAEDNTGKYWIGTDDGLSSFDPITDKFEKVTSNLYVTSLVADGGQLWLGTDNGLYQYEHRTKKLKSYLSNNSQLAKRNLGVLCLWRDSVENILVGTWDGLYVYDKQSDRFVRYKEKEIQGRVQAIFRDHSGDLWIGTRETLFRFSADSSSNATVERYQHDSKNKGGLSSNNVMAIYETVPGKLWIGTGGGGLNLFDKTEKRFQYFTWDDGLPSDNVHSILGDGKGNLWLSTDKGLCRLDKDNNQIITYTKQDGLQGDAFNIGAAFRASDGTLFFGGTDGLNSFQPDSVGYNSFSPPVYITELWLANKPVKPGTTEVLPASLLFLNKVTLTPSEKVFTLGFVALNYRNSSKTRFAYKMENFDEDWSYTDSDVRFATYTNLPPGKYIFKVRATNNDGIWSRHEAQLELVVLPPFWATWWFYTLVIFGISAIVFFVFRIRISNLRKAKQLLRYEVAERTNELRLEKENLERANEQITHQRDEIEAQKEEIEKNQQKLEEAQQLVIEQNKQLQTYNSQLEENVAVRTAELQQTMDKMMRANNELDFFVYRAAHDLRGPIVRLQGLCHVGQMEKDSYQAFQYLNRIQAVSHEMNTMLTRLLRTRVLNKQELMLATINLKQTVMMVVNKLLVEEKVFDIETKVLIDQSISLQLDVELFEILLQNIVQNALRYRDTERSSYIQISAQLVGQRMEMIVEDNGIGIAPEIGDSVFEMFFKGTDKSNGFGLGLYESRLITNRLGGQIKLLSSEAGVTRIQLILPLTTG